MRLATVAARLIASPCGCASVVLTTLHRKAAVQCAIGRARARAHTCTVLPGVPCSSNAWGSGGDRLGDAVRSATALWSAMSACSTYATVCKGIIALRVHRCIGMLPPWAACCSGCGRGLLPVILWSACTFAPCSKIDICHLATCMHACMHLINAHVVHQHRACKGEAGLAVGELTWSCARTPVFALRRSRSLACVALQMQHAPAHQHRTHVPAARQAASFVTRAAPPRTCRGALLSQSWRAHARPLIKNLQSCCTPRDGANATATVQASPSRAPRTALHSRC